MAGNGSQAQRRRFVTSLLLAPVVIFLSLCRVAQNFIRFLYFLKFLAGISVFTSVGMIAPGQGAVSLSDFLISGNLRNA